MRVYLRLQDPATESEEEQRLAFAFRVMLIEGRGYQVYVTAEWTGCSRISWSKA